MGGWDMGEHLARQELQGYVDSYHRKERGETDPPQLVWAARVCTTILVLATLAFLAWSVSSRL